MTTDAGWRTNDGPDGIAGVSLRSIYTVDQSLDTAFSPRFQACVLSQVGEFGGLRVILFRR